MKRVLLLTLLAVPLSAPVVEAATSTKIKADTKRELWVSPDRYSSRNVSFFKVVVVRKGHRIRGEWAELRGETCFGSYMTERLAIQVRHCGDPTRVKVRYLATKPMRFRVRINAR